MLYYDDTSRYYDDTSFNGPYWNNLRKFSALNLLMVH